MGSGKEKVSGRELAVGVLDKCAGGGGFADRLLSERMCGTDEPGRATDLVMGTMRNRTAIDLVVAELADCPAGRINRKVLNIIRVGCYELMWCPQTPVHAIINEAGQSARRRGGKKLVGFVNAVLRQVSRQIQSRSCPLEDAPQRNIFPQNPQMGCCFARELLADAKSDPAEYLGGAFSLPGWLIGTWLEAYGIAATRQICFGSNRRAGVYIRPNTLKVSREELLGRLGARDVEVRLAEDDLMVEVRGPASVAGLWGFGEGLFTIQDLTASRAVGMLSPRKGWRILDLCAAPGTKTAQIAETVGDDAEIIATDINPKRLEMVKENLTRLGINCVRLAAYEDIMNNRAKYGRFDAVLVDVPCSNTGVLAKRVEVRHRIKAEAIGKLTRTQKGLLSAASEFVTPGGRICYSTCSIQPEENEKLIEEFAGERTDLARTEERLTLPSAEGFGADGGFAAILESS